MNIIFYICFSITLFWNIKQTLSDCKVISMFISCINEYPNDSMISRLRGTYDVAIGNTHAKFVTNRVEKTGAVIHSLQIFKSTIYELEPRFFAKFSNNGLEKLSLSSVGGTYELNKQSLAGLEDTLVNLRVNDYELKHIEDLIMLQKLKTLQLVRTKLSRVPANFGQLLGQLNRVDLSDNQLEEMPWADLSERVKDPEFSQIQLGKNLWRCDCKLKPILALPVVTKQKVLQFRCNEPRRLQNRTLLEINVKDVCTNEEQAVDNEVDMVENKWDNLKKINHGEKPSIHSHENGNVPLVQLPDVIVALQTEPPLATAGNLSPEIITVIVAVIVLVTVIIIAVIVYKVRRRSQDRQQQERNRGVSHKTNSYCAVIEHNPPGRASNMKQPHYSSGVRPNNYTRGVMQHEREPLQQPSVYNNNPGYRDGQL